MTGKISEETQNNIVNLVWDEFTTSSANRDAEFADFEANLDILECKRTEKEYDWMSDVFIPEAPSIFLTESSHEATQYFASRDFVDVYLEDGLDEKQLEQCKVAKKTINLSLNNKNIRHFQKYMQARDINRMAGYVYAVCWWDQDVRNVQVGISRNNQVVLDMSGNMVIGENGQPVYEQKEIPVNDEIVVVDQFNWMPLDPRNVFPVNNKYTYSAQEEDGIIIRSEKTYNELKHNEKKHNYINLDKLKELNPVAETETSSNTYNKEDQYSKAKTDRNTFDILERYGRYPAIVKERDTFGHPIIITSAFEEDGSLKDGAEIAHARITIAYKGSTKVLIRFQAEPNRDGLGRPYTPIIRGLCYIHPTKKTGMSSAKYLRELQVASNDTINLSNDRVKLATFPSFVVNRYEAENNDQLYFEPEHMIPLDDVSQFKEIRITDNIQGAIQQYNLFRNSMQQVESVYPTTMGSVGDSNVTATAVQGADARSNIRNNYKSLTFEYTFNCELYWMLLQMTWQYMHKKTVQKMFTPKEIPFFNPVGDYTYQPVTSNIEVESNKYKKIQNYDQIIGRLSGLAQGNPAIIPVISHIVGRQLELLGDEYRVVEGIIKKLANTPMQQEEGGGAPINQPPDMQNEAVSNQNGVPMGNLQEYARGI